MEGRENLLAKELTQRILYKYKRRKSRNRRKPNWKRVKEPDCQQSFYETALNFANERKELVWAATPTATGMSTAGLYTIVLNWFYCYSTISQYLIINKLFIIASILLIAILNGSILPVANSDHIHYDRYEGQSLSYKIPKAFDYKSITEGKPYQQQQQPHQHHLDRREGQKEQQRSLFSLLKSNTKQQTRGENAKADRNDFVLPAAAATRALTSTKLTNKNVSQVRRRRKPLLLNDMTAKRSPKPATLGYLDNTEDSDKIPKDLKLFRRNYDNNCPTECHCLNDYFDCNKKHLDHVPDMPAYVKIIEFIGNKLNDTTVLLFRNLPELTKLILKRNLLESVPTFSQLLALEHLNLASNRIERISKEALAALPNLHNLDLSKNFIHTIEAINFPAGNQLMHLILNSNNITDIEENAFENLVNLIDLELNNNCLQFLPNGIFRNQSKLRKLYLNYNNLEINWSTFRGLTNLQKLYLKANNIHLLQDGVFHIMKSLDTIELDHNGISSLNRQGLFNLTKLRHLSLSNNSIRHIELDTWEFTQSLTTLNLSYNNISEFKPQHLDCLQRLRQLNLAHNAIQYLLETTFDCLKNLEDLNLRRNRLSWIIEDPTGVPPFKALHKLKKLDLYGNNLKQINAKSLSGLNHLEYLNLGGNALAAIQIGAFDHMIHLQKFIFKSLNFICDCNIGWFRNWLQHFYQSEMSPTSSSSSSSSAASQAVCAYPANLRDRKLISLQEHELKCVATPKPKLIIEPTSQLAVKGANITLECLASSPAIASHSSSTDELKVIWRHDNQNIKGRLLSNQLSHTSAQQSNLITTEIKINPATANHGDDISIESYLHMHNISYESAGKYQCVISNAFGTTYSQKIKISIGIHPSFRQIPSNLTLDSGGTARLVCSAVGDPMPEIALQKFGAGDFPAANERRLQVIREENAFVITNAKPSDSGTYTCTAESAAGEIKVNASILVNDKPLPDIPIVHKEIVLGKPSVLECLNDVTVNLNQPHREWFKDNKPFHITPILDAERYYFTAEKELLVIINTQSMDAGHYRCEITDAIKTYAMHMDVLVVQENFSQNIIIMGVFLVTIACISIGSLIVWLIMFYQKKKLHLRSNLKASSIVSGSGARVAAVNNDNTFDHTQLITEFNRVYMMRTPKEYYQCSVVKKRPRSLAALELGGIRFERCDDRDDEFDAITEQHNCLIMSDRNPTPLRCAPENENLQHEQHEHLSLQYWHRHMPIDLDSQQNDHLSSKDSGTGSDAAVKRSLEDIPLTILPNISMSTQNASLSKLDIINSDKYKETTATNCEIITSELSTSTASPTLTLNSSRENPCNTANSTSFTSQNTKEKPTYESDGHTSAANKFSPTYCKKSTNLPTNLKQADQSVGDI